MPEASAASHWLGRAVPNSPGQNQGGCCGLKLKEICRSMGTRFAALMTEAISAVSSNFDSIGASRLRSSPNPTLKFNPPNSRSDERDGLPYRKSSFHSFGTRNNKGLTTKTMRGFSQTSVAL